jgi:TPR repeat protein
VKPEAGPTETWNEALIDGASLRLAEQAARAAGVPLEEWLERAIRRACAGPGKTTVLPPGAILPDELGVGTPLRSLRRALLLLAAPLLLLASFAWLSLPPSGSGIAITLPPAPQVTVALPPRAAASPATVATSPAAPKPGAPSTASTAAPTDPAQLALWLKPRAERGDPLAEYRLGTLYALGKGVDKDYARAAPLLRAAAESGIAEAQYDYAVLCEKGYGVPKDPVQAVAWYRKAAAQGNANAALSLGYAYAKGIGVDRDMSAAAAWFRSAAEHGIVDAQFNLAFLYEHGDGVPKSAINAYGWYAIAASRGDQGSKTAADRLAHAFSPQQLDQAKARKAELQKSLKSDAGSHR